MALSNENNKISYTPSTATTEFNFPYPYFDDTDIIVTIEDSAGTITVLTPATEYTVAATNGDVASGCTVTTSSSYTSGDTVTISREVPYTQEYDLQEGSSIDPTALNKGLDRTVAQSQQIVDLIGRSVSHPVTDPSGLDYEAPSVTERASKALGWDSNGNIVALDLAESGSISGNANAGIDVTNNIISAKVDDTTVEFSSGDIAIKNGGVDTAQLAASAVETAKIADSNVTKAKIENVADMKALGNTSGSAAAPQEVAILDEDDMSSDSDTSLVTQQSVKAYVDAHGVVQVVNVQDGAKQYNGSATAIPNDDTIPQSHEGIEVMTLAITPTSAANKLKIEVVAHHANNGAHHVTALFKDSDADALAVAYSQEGASAPVNHSFTHYMTSGTASTITFKVRVGGNGAVVTFNGDNNNAALYGGVLSSSITITEIKA